jgi:hypothetical protein
MNALKAAVIAAVFIVPMSFLQRVIPSDNLWLGPILSLLLLPGNFAQMAITWEHSGTAAQAVAFLAAVAVNVAVYSVMLLLVASRSRPAKST